MLREWLRIPYVQGGTDPSVGLDCAGLCANVLVGMGLSDDVDVFSQNPEDCFVKLGDTHHAAELPGDVIMSEAPSNPGQPHLSILMAGSARRCLTSIEGVGVRVVAPWSIQHIVGVYRMVSRG